MKATAHLRRIELCCEVVLMAAILLAAAATAVTMYSVTTPPPPGSLVMDYVGKIGVMAAVLNIGLPLAVVALGAWILLQMRWGTLQPVAVALAIVGFLGVFGCAMATWAGLAAMHGPGIDLWSTHIWWS